MTTPASSWPMTAGWPIRCISSPNSLPTRSIKPIATMKIATACSLDCAADGAFEPWVCKMMNSIEAAVMIGLAAGIPLARRLWFNHAFERLEATGERNETHLFLGFAELCDLG